MEYIIFNYFYAPDFFGTYSNKGKREYSHFIRKKGRFSMKHIKRITAILIALAITCMFTTSVFAANAEVVFDETIATAEEIEARAPGKVLASNATTIYGGSGSLTVYLPSSNLWADLQAGIGYTPERGIVTCTAVAPNGQFYDLGNISGTGSYTNFYEMGYAPAGAYTFYFSSGITSPYEVIAYIYD